ncbi:MAG: RNA polymerase sigma factor [Actinomycetota bacterium]
MRERGATRLDGPGPLVDGVVTWPTSVRELLLDLLGPPPGAFVGDRAVGALLFTLNAEQTPQATSPIGGRPPRPGGDHPAADLDLDALVAEFAPAVYRLARSVVRDPALADDVTQDTFIKVWRSLADYRGEGSLRGWVLRIAHNTAVSTLRRVRDTATDPQRLPESAAPITTNRVVEGRLAAEELQTALDQLDELSREIVVLREVEGCSYDEIADALGVPVPTVKTRLLRARRRLATSLEAWRS